MKMDARILIFVGLFFVGTANIYGQQLQPPGVDSVVITFQNSPIVTVQKAPLQYNKAFAMSFQMDDALSDIFYKVYPVFHGNGVTPGLTYTDGCGHPITFKMSSGVYIFSSYNNSDILDPDDPYHDRNKLTWPQLDTLYRSHWGLENHGLFDNPDAGSSEKIEFAFQRTESYARRKISDSVLFRSFIIPNGLDVYVSYLAKNHYHSAINQGQDESWIGFGNIGFNVENDTIDWLKPVKLNRLFLYSDFKKAADSLYAQSKRGIHKWLLSGMHTLPENFLTELKEIYETYGSPGFDDILLAPDDEILDYFAVKQAVQIHDTLRGNKLIVTFEGLLPTDRLYYALSLNVFGNQPIEKIQIYGAKSSSFSGIGKDTALVNLAWDGRYYVSTEMLADSFTNLAMTTHSEWKALVAMDYVMKLPSGEKKIRLQDSLCSLDRLGWSIDYDPGFCNLVHLGSDTALCPEDSLLLTGPENMASYIWYQNDEAFSTSSSVTVSPDTTTAYALLVKDKYGNEMGDTINIKILPVPKVELGADTGLCAGSNLTLSASEGNYTYHWSNGDSLSSTIITPFSDTIVSVLVTTSNGCEVSDSIRIAYHLLPKISISQDSSIHCFGDSVFLTVSSTDSGLSYYWNNGDTSSSVSVLPSIPDTTYAFSVKAVSTEGCSSLDTAHILVLPAVAVKMGTVNYHTCNNEPITISCSVVQGDFISYIWSYDQNKFGTETDSITLYQTINSGWVHLVATDSNDCIATDSTFLNVIAYPQIIIPGDTGVCSGDSLVLSGSGGNIFYWLLGTDTVSQDSVLHIKPSQQEDYIAVSGFDTLCMSRDSLTVSLFPLPEVKIIKENAPVCMNTEITLKAVGASSYNWLPDGISGDTFSIKPVDTIMVHLVGTSEKGCKAKDSLLLSPASLPVAHFSGLMPSYCENDPPVTLTGEPSGGMFSGDGVEDTAFFPAVAGHGNHTITYTVVSTEGCRGKSSKETYIYGPIPTIRLTPSDTTLLPEGFVQYDAGPGFDAYYWTTGDLTQKIKVDYSEFPVGTDTIRVVGITGGCSSVGSAVIVFGEPAGIVNTRWKPLYIYPNPAHQTVSISFRGHGNPLALDIFSLSGKRILRKLQPACSGDCSIKLDISHLKPGIYFVWMYNQSGSCFSKMIVQ